MLLLRPRVKVTTLAEASTSRSKCDPVDMTPVQQVVPSVEGIEPVNLVKQVMLLVLLNRPPALREDPTAKILTGRLVLPSLTTDRNKTRRR